MPRDSSIPVSVAPGPEGDAVLREPPRHDLRARGIHHPRQDARGDLDDGQGGAAGEDGIQDREGDEARAHHDDAAPRRDAGDHRACLRERPEAVHAGPVGAGDRRLGRARAGRDQAVVELDGGAVIEGQCAACHVEPLGPAAEHGLDVPGRERGGRGRVDVRLGDGLPEVVRQDHARIRPLGRDERDLGGGLATLLFSNRPDAVEARGAAPDDQMAGRHHAPPARVAAKTSGVSILRTYAVRSAAKSPIQSAVSASS